MKISVSVIVPIYKVENFIERNAHQLFQQDLPDIELIFVDDCSPDNSVALLKSVMEEYPEKKTLTTIIRHPKNMGLPSARNSGLAIARGEFVFHCDGDDWLETTALSQLYRRACFQKADIVWCDWYLSFKNSERYMSQAPPSFGPISGRRLVTLMLRGGIRYNVWNKLIKRCLYEEFSFPDGYAMGEDMLMIQLAARANRVVHLPKALYHYVQVNPAAYTQNIGSQQLTELRHNVDCTIEFLQSAYGLTIENELHFFKLNVKLPFLISKEKKDYQRWSEWYPESNAFIAHNPLFKRRVRFIQYAALNKYYWILRLYYCVVVKFIYGRIYK